MEKRMKKVERKEIRRNTTILQLQQLNVKKQTNDEHEVTFQTQKRYAKLTRSLQKNSRKELPVEKTYQQGRLQVVRTLLKEPLHLYLIPMLLRELKRCSNP